MSFKMPTGKKLDSMLDKLSAKDIKEIRAQFELDVQKENQKGYAEINIPNDLKFYSKQDAIDCIEKIMKALDISKEDLRRSIEK